MYLTCLQPQAGQSDPKQAEEKKMKKKRIQNPPQVTPGLRLQAAR